MRYALNDPLKVGTVVEANSRASEIFGTEWDKVDVGGAHK